MKRLIGRSYIAIARQDKIYRNKSNALGRTKYISNISYALRRLRSDHEYLVYILAHHSELEKKEKTIG